MPWQHEGGRNQLTGEHRGREAVFGLLGKLMELTEGFFCTDIHAVFADDEHGVALVVVTASRGGGVRGVGRLSVLSAQAG
jgi:hypothetical protein